MTHTPDHTLPFSARLASVFQAMETWSGPAAFFFEFGTTTAMFAPADSFFDDIPDAPLPSLGGHIAGTDILEAFAPANDPVSVPSEKS